eukprot:snap_masked-scaffold_42-processed-gene-2.9-mRNA-1 protein AED:0.14 eAED:0.14 QI:0/-1/0/1/-1/1/1/0/317
MFHEKKFYSNKDEEMLKNTLKKIDEEIFLTTQSLLKDFGVQEKRHETKDKFKFYVEKYSKNLLNGKFYNETYRKDTQELKLKRKGVDEIITVKPKKTKQQKNVHIFSSKNDSLEVWIPPPFCIPITADVRKFDFMNLAKKQKEVHGKLFDVILTDPPWQLATHNPTRGVALGYNQLSDDFLLNIPFGKLQDNGYIFIWIINAKFELALKMLEKNGYEFIDEIVWVKTTVNRRLARSHGFYLQHGKESCIVGRKGKDPVGVKKNVDIDVLFSQRSGQSQKPVELYQMIERLVPNGSFLEVFGRRNNLRNFWTTIGNEL